MTVNFFFVEEQHLLLEGGGPINEDFVTSLEEMMQHS